MNCETIRRAYNSDSPRIISLIADVYREYGDEIYLEGADKDLVDIEGYYRQVSGDFVILERNDEIAGTHAVLPLDLANRVITFRRLYLRQELRGSGCGKRLMKWAIDWSMREGYHSVEFWSDIRFQRAHRFFQQLGFTKGDTRNMTDGAMPYSEYQFSMNLFGQNNIA